MADQPKKDTTLKPDGEYIEEKDQAEGERGGGTSPKVKRNPSQAEGDRETVEQAIRDKERQGKL